METTIRSGSERERWLTLLRSAAQLRFGPERANSLHEELETMADAISRVLAEPLDFDDEPLEESAERNK